jgi:hypothetical protein
VATSSRSITIVRAHDDGAADEIELVVSTRDEAHCRELLATLRGAGPQSSARAPPE